MGYTRTRRPLTHNDVYPSHITTSLSPQARRRPRESNTKLSRSPRLPGHSQCWSRNTLHSLAVSTENSCYRSEPPLSTSQPPSLPGKHQSAAPRDPRRPEASPPAPNSAAAVQLFRPGRLLSCRLFHATHEPSPGVCGPPLAILIIIIVLLGNMKQETVGGHVMRLSPALVEVTWVGGERGGASRQEDTILGRSCQQGFGCIM